MSSRARRLPASTPVDAFNWGGPRQAERRTPERSPETAVPFVEPHAMADSQPVASPVQLAEIEREAFAKGFAQGERSGQEVGNQRAEAMLGRLTETLQELTQLRAQMIHQTERQMVELALAVARRVVHREVSLDPDLLVAMARVALDRLGEAATITVRLSPDDFQMAGAAGVAQLDASNVTVVADGRIARGGCRIESEMGIIEAGIDAQIQEIAQALLGRAEATAGAAVAG